MATLAATALVLIWGYFVLVRQNGGYSALTAQTAGLSIHSIPKAEWVKSAVETTIDEPASLSPVVDLCNLTEWEEGLVFNCVRVRGGIGNVKNIVLTCLRYAIEAGASGFIIPDIDTRNEDDLIQTSVSSEQFGYLLDREHFVNSVRKACPQIKIYQNMGEFENTFPTYSSAITRGKEVGGNIIKKFTYAHPEEWKEKFTGWLQTTVNHTATIETPILVTIDWAMFEWLLSHETIDFIRAFGQLVRNQPDATELAAVVLYELAQQLATEGIEIDPQSGIARNAFYGAHLRTASDAQQQGWQSYEVQSKHYMEHASRLGLKTIYISSGSEPDVERFSETAMKDYGMNVTHKGLLLQGEDLAHLKNMTWDQRGIVDYEVMLKASAVGGIDMSSFSLNLAMRRHGLVIDPTDKNGWEKLSNNQSLTIADGLSEILRDPRDLFNIWLGLWP